LLTRGCQSDCSTCSAPPPNCCSSWKKVTTRRWPADQYLLLLASLVFERRVVLYMASENYTLLSGIYNFGFREELELCKVAGLFYPVLTKARYEAFYISQQIVQELLPKDPQPD
jgi:hypothetical protein